MASRDSNSPAPEREIVSTRIFSAPRELVWRAWTEPEMLAQWWGPNGFANSVYECDVRPGGVWRFTMHGPDGKEYLNEIRFVEFVRPERIVLDHTTWPHFRVVATFEELSGRTRVTFRQIFESAADYDKVKGVAVPGNEQNFDRMGALLPQLADDNSPIVLVRTYDAPRERVFKAFTDPAELARWFGPDGFTLTTLAHACRPGGHWRWVFHGPDGTDYKDRIDYLEVVAPQRLVYWHSDDGVGAQPPFHVTILFGEHDGKTTVTMRSQFASAAERARIIGFGAIEGGKQTLARLGTHLGQA